MAISFPYLATYLHQHEPPSMKDLSFFLLKNSLGSKMRRGFRSFCNGDASTSTLNQHKTMEMEATTTPDHDQYTYHGDDTTTATTTLLDKESRPPTLEEMILQLEVEEEIARKAKLREYYASTETHQQQRRMSCVNNSDILRSARNALNQYPRFSLDGKDAMYRSSFRNLQAQVPARKSTFCNRGRGNRCYTYTDEFESKLKPKPAKLEKRTATTTRTSCLPTTIAGESVIWCKPGVVAKLMGLEVMPVPVPVVGSKTSTEEKYYLNSRQNLRRRAQSHEKERRSRSSSSCTVMADMKNGCISCSTTAATGTRAASSRSSKGRYSVMRPLSAPQLPNNNHIDGVGWPIAHFL